METSARQPTCCCECEVSALDIDEHCINIRHTNSQKTQYDFVDIAMWRFSHSRQNPRWSFSCAIFYRARKRVARGQTSTLASLQFANATRPSGRSSKGSRGCDESRGGTLLSQCCSAIASMTVFIVTLVNSEDRLPNDRRPHPVMLANASIRSGARDPTFPAGEASCRSYRGLPPTQSSAGQHRRRTWTLKRREIGP